MKKYFSTLPLLALLAACGPKQSTDFTVTVTNDLSFDRAEMVEVPISEVAKKVQLIDEEQYIVLDAEGNQVAYQITYDDNLLFPVNVKAGDKAVYTIAVGEPIEAEPLVYGRHYPERVDDIAWENDRTAYRAYGPALQAKGERAFGYDAWVKRVPGLVVEQRYANELNPDTQAEIARLRKERKYDEANELYHSVSYHVDHGNGLDCYKVGPTLGCGTAALMQGDAILYPYCWKEYEILENGPLRFTVKLTYNPLVVGKDTVIETRTISLAQGSQLNKTVVSYAGLTKAAPVATGLVIHPENPTAYVLEGDKGYIAYADLTDNVNNGNGVIYVGAVMPAKVQEAKAQMFADKEAKERGASGHVLAISNYKPETEYTYYWGSGWSKYGFDSMEAWTTYLDRYAQSVRKPLKVEY
ncbi:MAG: DUF4861 domain-containing protein [Bacteroidaceae bacterium]|nr:DUF4861 domain-containing protein [Bacteroidaceae bacterium]MBR4042132.1 DUF4861 domain-containing protein [Bacteroidaceae bacterium]